ncbi:LuxR C-terminal-related transcriptional regulator [Polaromonas sp. P1(28)-8]|nr:LuxR C-terminal-related transcriptional regulator [Polaromonas sp. P1(28)-8]
MSIEHLFLTTPAAPVPERWCEAFPAGRVHEAPAMLDHLRGRPANASLIWLSTADAQWAVQLRQVLQVLPGVPVVVVSGRPHPLEGLDALDKGARGYTHAYAVPALLQEVALVVEHGGLWVGPDLMRRLVASTHAALARLPAAPAAAAVAPGQNAWAQLSAREAEVAHAVSAGRSNKEVATLMHISERTVKAHLGAVFEKLGVRDRLQLVLRLAASADTAQTPERELLS